MDVPISRSLPALLHSNGRRSNTATQRVLQAILLAALTAQTRAERDRFIADCRSLDSVMLSRPDILAGFLLLLAVFRDDVPHCFLEVQRALLHLRMELPVDKNASVEVPLRVDAQVLVLGHDPLVHVADQVEIFVAGVLVSVDFVSHD